MISFFESIAVSSPLPITAKTITTRPTIRTGEKIINDTPAARGIAVLMRAASSGERESSFIGLTEICFRQFLSGVQYVPTSYSVFGTQEGPEKNLPCQNQARAHR